MARRISGSILSLATVLLATIRESTAGCPFLDKVRTGIYTVDCIHGGGCVVDETICSSVDPYRISLAPLRALLQYGAKLKI